MPAPAPRDSKTTREAMTTWFNNRAQLSGAEITYPETSESPDLRSEILMMDVAYGGDDGSRDAIAVRVAPLNYQFFPEGRFEQQYRLMRICTNTRTSRCRRPAGTSRTRRT